MTEEKLEKVKKIVGTWEFEMQSENIEEVLAAQGNFLSWVEFKLYYFGFLKVWISVFRLYHQIRNKNDSEIEKLRSRDRRIFEKNLRICEIETLTHNIVKYAEIQTF